MAFLAEFVDTLLRGFVLMGAAVAVGGIAWALCVLRAWPRSATTAARAHAPAEAVRRGLALVAAGAAAVAAGQALLLVIKGLVLSDVFGYDTLADFTGTLHFVAGAVRVLVSLALAGALARLRRAIDA